jgi:hypothetical protein
MRQNDDVKANGFKGCELVWTGTGQKRMIVQGIEVVESLSYLSEYFDV